jgi:RNA polymerase primary sigma factor
MKVINKIYVTTGAIATDTYSVRKYMGEIKKTPLLTREQEADATRDQLIESNLRFVVQVAKQYQGMGLELEDLIAFGNLGLFEAAERFDRTRKIKFITFAVWYVRAEITKSLNDMGRTVRIPSHKTKTEAYSTISTQTVIGENEDSAETYADRFLAAPEELSRRDQRDLSAAIATALDQLKPKQRAAVAMFYGIGVEYPCCMEDIAEKLGVSNERARQLVRAGEDGLKNLSGLEILKQYL